MLGVAKFFHGLLKNNSYPFGGNKLSVYWNRVLANNVYCPRLELHMLAIPPPSAVSLNCWWLDKTLILGYSLISSSGLLRT